MPTLTYLDHAATAAAHPAAVDAALRALVEPDQGAAKCLIESQKRRWGLSYGVLTSGATEANHLALERFDSERLILASPCLHPSLLAAVRLRAHDWLAVGADGCLDSQAGARQVAGAPPGTALVIDAVDGVSGAWHPWADLVCAAARAGLPVHLDASQIVGCDPLSTYPDFSLALSGHKAGAVAGIGCLLASRPIRAASSAVEPAWCAAWERLLDPSLEADMIGHLRRADDALRSLVDQVDGLRLLAPVRRRPGIVSAVAKGLSGALLVEALDDRGIAVSAGSACAAGRTAPPFGLQRAGWSDDELRGLVRFSSGWRTDPDALALLLPLVQEAVADVAEVMR